MNKKLYQEAPQAELIIIQFDQVIMGPSDPNSVRPNSASSGYNGDGYDLGDLDE